MYLRSLTKDLIANHISVGFVYNNTGPRAFEAELRNLGATFHPVTPRRLSVRKNRSDLNQLFSTEPFDVLHCHVNTLSYVTPALLALRHGIPVIMHSHSSAGPNSLANRALHQMHSRSFPFHKTTNIAVARPAAHWIFNNRNDVEIIKNGIEPLAFQFDVSLRRQTRAKLGLEDQLTIIHVGAFLEAKNHTFILQVFKSLLRERPGAMLVLVGAGPLEASVKDAAERMGLSGNILFTGTRSDIPELLFSADVFLFPSLYEGYPLAVLEAQAAGLPCIVSQSITEEVAVTNLCHRLPLSDGPQAWATTLLQAVDSVTTRETAASALESGGYSTSQMTQRIREIYLTVQEQSAVRRRTIPEPS